MILMFHDRVFDPDGGFKAFDGPGQSGCHQTSIFKAFEGYGYTNIAQTIDCCSVWEAQCHQTIIFKAFEV